MSSKRDAVKAAARAGKREEVRQLRTEAVIDKWATHSGKNQRGCLTVATPHGAVHIAKIRHVNIHDAPVLEVWLDGATDLGESHFRIVNPPMLVPDVGGEITVGDQKFREDPIAAVAYIIAGNGGAAKKAKRQ